jgi:hypothetical protein
MKEYMSSRITKAIAVLAIVVASFGITSFGVDNSTDNSTKKVQATSTTKVSVDPGPSQEEVDALYSQIWINKTNEKIWVDTTNSALWIKNTNARIAAQKLASERRAASISNTGSGGGATTGGGHSSDFLACVRAHESDTAGGYSAQNPSSSASGAYQILDSTWQNYGGYPTAASAPPSVQDERAHQLPRSAWNGSGC